MSAIDSLDGVSDAATSKVYSVITMRTNAILGLVTFAKQSGVKTSSRNVAWKYYYEE